MKPTRLAAALVLFCAATALAQEGVNPANDAFGRLRVSDPVSIFDSTFQYDLQPLLWETVKAGKGDVVHTATDSGATLSVTAADADSAALQTYVFHRYQPGKSQLVEMTFVLGATAAGVTKRVGYFDANNGVFIEHASTGLSIVKRSNQTGSIVDTKVAQASWNIDRLDGTGASRINLDPTKAQILVIDLQWLGVGRVRVGFVIDGMPVYAHQFNHANTTSTAYMRTANLPLRYELDNSTSTAGTMLAICASVISEGGFETERGYQFGYASTTARTSASRRAILSIRPSTTFNSIATRFPILPEAIDVGIDASGLVLVELVLSPTYTTGGGALTWTAFNATYSGVEYSVHGDANAGAFTGGVVLQSFLVASGSGASRGAASADLRSRIALTLDAAGTGQRALAVVTTNLSGTPGSFATITWRELR